MTGPELPIFLVLRVRHYALKIKVLVTLLFACLGFSLNSCKDSMNGVGNKVVKVKLLCCL